MFKKLWRKIKDYFIPKPVFIGYGTTTSSKHFSEKDLAKATEDRVVPLHKP